MTNKRERIPARIDASQVLDFYIQILVRIDQRQAVLLPHAVIHFAGLAMDVEVKEVAGAAYSRS